MAEEDTIQKLFLACRSGDDITLQKLPTSEYLKIRWDKGGPDFDDGDTLLHVAAGNGKKRAVEVLLKLDTDVRKTETYQQQASHGAVETPSVVDARNMLNRTPLHLASKYGHSDVVETLVEHGAFVDSKDSYERTPLHLASIMGNTDVVETLIKNGVFVDSVDINKRTSLHLSSEYGYADVANALIRSGAVVNAQDGRKCTPLHLVFDPFKLLTDTQIAYENVIRQEGQSEMKKFIVKATRLLSADQGIVRKQVNWKERPSYWPDDVPYLDPNNRGKDGNFPSESDLQIMLYFLKSWHKENFLRLNREGEREKLTELLLSKHADVNAKDSKGATPLHMASCQSNAALAQLLIEKGAKVNMVDETGRTPLHYASCAGQLAVVQLLLEKEAIVNAVDTKGDTPLSLAFAGKHTKVCHLLSMHGASYIKPVDDLAADFGNLFLSKPEEAAVEASNSQINSIGEVGGEIRLPNVVLHVPPKAVADPVDIRVTEIKFCTSQQEQLKSTGLEHFLQSEIQLQLEPHGLKFLCKVLVKLNVELSSNEQLLIYHKDKDSGKETLWTDVTMCCAPKNSNDGVIFKIDRLSTYHIWKYVDLAAVPASLYIDGLLNSKQAQCKFHAYYKPSEPHSPLVAIVQTSDADSSSLDVEPGYVKRGYNVSRFDLLDGEPLHFCYENCSTLAKFKLKMTECENTGQKIFLPIPQADVKYQPDYLVIKRSETDQVLCEVSLQTLGRQFQEKLQSGTRGETMQASSSIEQQMSELSLQEEGIRCITKEEWIGKPGGEIRLPNAHLYVPSDSVTHSVLLSVTERDISSQLQQDIEKTGLQDYLQPGIQLILQPHGYKFHKKVILKLKYVCKLIDRSQLMIFHKDVEPDRETLWTDITEECAHNDEEGYFTLKIDKFSKIQPLLTKISSSASSIFVCGLLNKKSAPCRFYTFYFPGEPLEIIVKKEKDSERPSCKPGYEQYGNNVSRLALIQGETLHFYYDACNETDECDAHEDKVTAAERQLDLSKCRVGGQYMALPVRRYPPRRFCIHRLEPKQFLCCVLRKTDQEKADDTGEPQASSSGESNHQEQHHVRQEARQAQVEARCIITELNLRDKWISANKDTLVKYIQTQYGLLERLVSNDVITDEEEKAITGEGTGYKIGYEQSKELIKIIRKVDHRKYLTFLEVLGDRQADLAKLLKKDTDWRESSEALLKAQADASSTKSS